MKKKKLLSKKLMASILAGTMITGATLLLYAKDKFFPVPAYTVARVIDGDTFETTEKQLIRLGSTDAPELEYCGGPEAKRELEKLVLKKPVYLKVQYRDRYMRLISLVYTPDGSVNEAMIRSGNADYVRSSKEIGVDLQAASEYARTHQIGIYNPKCTQMTNLEKPSCNIKGNNRTQKIYFTSDCGFYNQVQVQLYAGDQWFCTEKEASEAGYRKTTQCNPKQ